MGQASGAELAAKIDAIARERMSGGRVAGMSIAVARDGKIVFARGYGMANLEAAAPVTPETIFHIASISKNIEAAVLLQLVEQGKLSLDDDVTKYVPKAPTHGQHITIAQLINHTSGIHSFTSLPGSERNESLDLTHDEVLALIKDSPLDFSPGAGFRYNNSGFYLAGMVVERITGQEYGAYVREHVFKPLGMESASLCYARQVVPRRASGYDFGDGKLVNAAPITWMLPFAAGAVCATATDLVKWQAALDGGRVLGPKTLARMRTPTVLRDGTRIDYGLGTRLGSLDGHRVVGHTGGGGGFTTVLESFPQDRIIIAALINTGSAAATTLAGKIARTLLGTHRELVDLPVPAAEAAAQTGTFDSDDGPLEVFLQAGKLRFRPVGSHDDGAPMRRQQENLYAIDELIEVRILMRDHRAAWGVAYSGGLMMDAKYRVEGKSLPPHPAP